jgi:hypothetical protein
MYDLNLFVPNITSQKYSTDNRFVLLKNYLYELNETLAIILGEQYETQTTLLQSKVDEGAEQSRKYAIDLRKENIARFNSLKEQIIRTAEDIEAQYKSEISKTQEQILAEVERVYTTKSEYGDYVSAVNTALRESAEEIALLSENTQTVRTDLENFKDVSRSELSVQAGAIVSRVENEFQSKTQAEEMESRISSQITQATDSVTETFSEEITILQEDVSTVGGTVAELISNLDVYIRRGELEEGVYGIEIGRSDSHVKARFTNERLSFYQGVSEVAYISGSTLYISNADVLDYLRIGNSTQGYFLFDTTQNGLEVRWIDGN